MPSHAHVERCARLNVMRLNAARLNFYETDVPIAVVDGVERSKQVRIAGAQVAHVLNDAPDTASVRVDGFVPVAGQAFGIYLGDRSTANQIFGGRILETTALYESKHENVAHDLRMIDPTWLLNRRRVLWAYVNIPATSIVLDIMARWGMGFTVANVAPGLPVIDAITFTNETIAAALTAICERIGAYWYVDYAGDVHVALSTITNTYVITQANHRQSRDHTLVEDLSQVVTRIIARGGGGSAVVDCGLSATELPIDDDTWFAPGGGIAEVAGSQRITYTDVKGRGGAGALVGVSVGVTSAPTTAVPTSNINSGGSLPSGVYKYAITFTNATGETLPGPTASVTVGGSAPTLAKTSVRPGYYQDWNGHTPGGAYSWRIALYYTGGGYSLGPPTDAIVTGDRQYEIFVGYPERDPANGLLYYPALTTGAAGEVTQTEIYRTLNGGATWYLEKIYTGVVHAGGGWVNSSNQMSDGNLASQSQYPAGPVATFNAASVGGFQTIPTGFTGRKCYRTPVNGSQLKMFWNNPPDPFLDKWDDTALQGNAPTSDTSGVVASGTQTVPAGSTSLPVTDATAFTNDGGASGGWANVGNLAIKYAGVTGASLTGIPATGVGSLSAPVRHGAAVLIQPRLVGVYALTLGCKAGDPVVVRADIDDTDAQLALAQRFGSSDPAVGVVEEPFSDSRMTLGELVNYGKALLADRKDPRRTLRFQTRDSAVDVGRVIDINLTTPPIVGKFRVQRVAFSEIAITGGLARVQPLRTVEASNRLYTLADLLRRLRGREGGAG